MKTKCSLRHLQVAVILQFYHSYNVLSCHNRKLYLFYGGIYAEVHYVVVLMYFK